MEVMGHGDPFEVVPPSWRPDIVLEEDLTYFRGNAPHSRIRSKHPEELPEGRSTLGGARGPFRGSKAAFARPRSGAGSSRWRAIRSEISIRWMEVRTGSGRGTQHRPRWPTSGIRFCPSWRTPRTGTGDATFISSRSEVCFGPGRRGDPRGKEPRGIFRPGSWSRAQGKASRSRRPRSSA